MNSSKNSKQSLIAGAAIVIIALLGLNAYFLVDKNKNQKLMAAQQVEIDEAEKLKTELEKQYYEALSELEEMRGSNEELNGMIDKQKEELKSQKDKISQMIRSGRANKSELANARKQLEELMTQNEQYIAEITQLKETNTALTNQNVQLSEAKTALETEVANERVMNEELTTAKAALVTEKETLETEKAELSRKVGIASVVKVGGLDISGWKVKKSGKPVKKRYAKNIDRLTVCFNATENNVVEPGNEQFYVRVINPVGETLAIEELGSGVISSTNTSEQIRYTTSSDLEYTNAEANVCVNWEPNIPFQKGTYEVQVYNKGFLAGQSSFTLK